MFSRLRIFFDSPSRPHTAPQQYSVTSSCRGMLKSSALASALSTNSAPITDLRIAKPLSKSSLFICRFLVVRVRRKCSVAVGRAEREKLAERPRVVHGARERRALQEPAPIRPHVRECVAHRVRPIGVEERGRGGAVREAEGVVRCPGATRHAVVEPTIRGVERAPRVGYAVRIAA